jgi:hypothetical protein
VIGTGEVTAFCVVLQSSPHYSEARAGSVFSEYGDWGEMSRALSFLGNLSALLRELGIALASNLFYN